MSETEQVEVPECVTLWICCHCRTPRTVGLSVCERCHKRLYDKVEYFRASVVAPQGDATGWLLEKMHNGNVHYISADYVLQWTDDPNKALRLARREDAEALCTIVEDCEKIASHEWVPAATSTTSDGEQVCKCGLPKDDAIHSFSTEWQQMHKFTLKDAATPPPAVTPTPDSIRKAAAQAAQDLYALGWLRAAPAKANEAIIASLLRHLSAATEAGEQEHPYFVHARDCKTCGPNGFCSDGLRLYTALPSTSAAIRAAAEEIAAWVFRLEHPLTSETDLNATAGIMQGILSRYFGKGETAAPLDALSRANKLCRSGIGGATVELIFREIPDAQAVHKWVVTISATPAAPSPGEPPGGYGARSGEYPTDEYAAAVDEDDD